VQGYPPGIDRRRTPSSAETDAAAIPSRAIGATTAPPVTAFAKLPPFSTMTPTATCGNAAGREAREPGVGRLPVPWPAVPDDNEQHLAQLHRTMWR